MRWERWRIAWMLAPTLLLIAGLFGSALVCGLLQSLGWQPVIGRTDLSLQAYADIVAGPRHAQEFWSGLLLTLWVSMASTLLSAAIAVAAALLLRRMIRGKRLASFFFQFNLPIPHIVAAVGVLFVLSQSGLLARAAAQMGLITGPSQFPVLVRDRAGSASSSPTCGRRCHSSG